MNLNKAFVLGNLTRDPEAKNLPSGQLVANFGLATNRIWKDRNTGQQQKQVEFHNIVTFGKLAEIAQQYLKRGSMILIEGRIQTRSWEGQDGVKKYRTEIIAEALQLGPKNQNTPAPAGTSTLQEQQSQKKEIKDEEIPTIEEGYAPSSAKEEEIDVKDLPL